MKKIFGVIIVILIFCGCQSKVNNQEFIASIKELKDISRTEKISVPFDIFLSIDKKNESTIEYILTIDNPKDAVYNISVVMMDEFNDMYSYPTSGIFDKKLSLVPNVINKDSGYVKEIKLIGKINYEDSIDTFHTVFKAKISYEDKEGNKSSFYYLKQI